MEPSKSEIEKEGNLRHAAHGLFAKIQQKTGMDDKKIDEFQKKWLELPETRTKYNHWWDTTAIAGEELYAMFNDIIEFMQDQEGGKSHVFASLSEEADQIKKSPQAYFQHLVVIGKNWMRRGFGFAKSIGKKEAPATKIENNGSKAEGGQALSRPDKTPAAPTLVPGEERAEEVEQTEEDWFGGGMGPDEEKTEKPESGRRKSSSAPKEEEAKPKSATKAKKKPTTKKTTKKSK